jgi:uncharacterized protein
VIPERTCVGCRERGAKYDLIRVVRSAAGDVEADPSGWSPGRGAYVHRAEACIDAALDRGGFARGLRVGLAPEGAARLRADLRRLMGAV